MVIDNMRIKHKLEETNDSNEKKKRARISDESKEAETSSKLMSLDENDAPMAVEENATALPTLASIVLNPSLTDKEKIAALSERIKNKTGNIREKDDEGRNLLHLACMKSGVELVEWLLGQEKDFYTEINKSGSNVLFLAAMYANKPLLYYFLEKQPSLASVITLTNNTALHYAADGGDTEIFSAILERQTKPLVKHFFNLNPFSILSCAVMCNRLEFIQWLAREHIEFMVPIDIINKAIRHAKTTKRDSIASFLQSILVSKEWCKYLIERQLHDKPNSIGFYPIHQFAEYGTIESVELLLEAKVPVDIQSENESKNTPLHLAADSGQFNMIKLLVKRGAKLNQFNAKGWHPIHCAASRGHTEIVAWLLSQNVPVNLATKDRFRNTAMYLAVHHGHLNLVELLYQHKAEIKKPCGILWLAKHVATYYKRPGVVWNLIHVAAFYNRPSIVKWLLEKGVSPDQPSEPGDALTPLLLALLGGHFEVVEILTAYKAKYTVLENKSSKDEKAIQKSIATEQSTNLEFGDLEQRLLLAAARYAKAIPILNNLLASGVSINTFIGVFINGKDPVNCEESKDSVVPASDIPYQVTAIHEAVRYNNFEGVKFLLKKKANPYIEGYGFGGIFALTIASGNSEIFQLLLPSVIKAKKDRDNKRRLFIAEMSGGIPKLTSDNTLAYHRPYFIFKKPFPKKIFAIMHQNFTAEEMFQFAYDYLRIFCQAPLQDKKVLDAFIDLIKQDANSYTRIVICQHTYKDEFSSDALIYIKKISSHLFKPIFEDEKFLPLLSQNNYALMIKIVRFCKDKPNIIKLLTRTSFNKDLNILSLLLSQSRDQGAAAIVESVPEAQRKELITFNNFIATDTIFRDCGFKTFNYLLYELRDLPLSKQIISGHLVPGFNSALYAWNRSFAWIRKSVEFFIYQFIFDVQKDEFLFARFQDPRISNLHCCLIDYLLNRITDSNKRRNTILSLATNISLSYVNKVLTPLTPDQYRTQKFDLIARVDLLLSLLDEERDRELFLTLMPKSITTIPFAPFVDFFSPTLFGKDPLFDEFVQNKKQFARVAAFHNIHQKYGNGHWLVHHLLSRAKFLQSLVLTSKARIIPQLGADISLYMATFLTGLHPALIEHVMKTMQIDGINMAKAKGILEQKGSSSAVAASSSASVSTAVASSASASSASSASKAAVPDAKSELLPKIKYYFNSTLFIQRMNVVNVDKPKAAEPVVDKPKDAVQKALAVEVKSSGSSDSHPASSTLSETDTMDTTTNFSPV